MQKLLQKAPAARGSNRLKSDASLPSRKSRRSSRSGTSVTQRVSGAKAGQGQKGSRRDSDETTLSLSTVSTQNTDVERRALGIDFAEVNSVFGGEERGQATDSKVHTSLTNLEADIGGRGSRQSSMRRVSIKSNEEEEEAEEEEYEEEEHFVLPSKWEEGPQGTTSEKSQEGEDDDFEDFFSKESSFMDLGVVQDLIEEPNFFDELSEIPDIADISSDLEEEPIVVEVVQEQYDEQGRKLDLGKFVDALTGEPLTSFSQLDVARSQTRMTDKGERDIGEEEDGLSFDERSLYEQDLRNAELDLKSMIESVHSDETFDLPESIQSEEEVKEGYDVEQLILEMEAPTVKVLDDVKDDKEARAAEEARLQLEAQTEDFLHDLINRIVDRCEYLSPAKLLRQNMDKKRVMEELENRLDLLDVEQMVRLFLNRKCVEYFRRKKNYRAIMEDNPETIKQDMDKFKRVTFNLDILLGREQDMLNVTGPKVIELGREVREMENKAEHSVFEFERLAKDVIRYNDRTLRFQKMVSDSLDQVSHYRDEISSRRLMLIQRLHTSARLAEKIEKLEYIGEGLSLRNFEHLQTDLVTLDKKIEERCTELDRMHFRNNVDLHIITHIREKQQIVLSTIQVQEKGLDELIDDKNCIRKRIYHLKMKRAEIRREVHDLTIQGGLLSKPALMLDYDDTLSRLREENAKMTKMRLKAQELQKKIYKLESPPEQTKT